VPSTAPAAPEPFGLSLSKSEPNEASSINARPDPRRNPRCALLPAYVKAPRRPDAAKRNPAARSKNHGKATHGHPQIDAAVSGLDEAFPIVQKLADRIANIGQREMLRLFAEAGRNFGCPAAGQLLERAHINVPVVEIGFQLRHVA